MYLRLTTRGAEQQGVQIDRYGTTQGKYLSPIGTSYPERALPADAIGQGYHVYEVVRPVDVIQSRVEKAFGETGGGKQYRLDQPLSWYLDPANGPYLMEITP